MLINLPICASGVGVRAEARAGATAAKSPQKKGVKQSLFLVEALNVLLASLLFARLAKRSR